MHEGLLLRYRTGSGRGRAGRATSTRSSPARSGWCRAYAGAGRDEEARHADEAPVCLANDLGLLAEEYDPVRERMVGNFPQAFSHLALISAARQAGRMTSHLLDNLELLEAETRALLATATRLDDAAMAAPSLCEGWTRAHVVTHVARNADALCHLARWATTGVPTPMYASPEARDADIVEGARRPAAEQVADLVSSAARFAEIAPSLAGPPRSGRWRCAAAGRCPAVTCRRCGCGRSSSTTSTWTWASHARRRRRRLRRAHPAPRRRHAGRRAGGAVAADPQRRGRRVVDRRRGDVPSPAAGRPCCCGSPGAGRTRSRPRGRCRHCLPWG